MLHRQVHALELAALDLVVPGSQGADGQYDGVVLAAELLDGQIDADLAVGDEPRALGPHLRQSLVQRGLL